MKPLLLLIVCLSAKALVGSEPPPSPRDGREAGKEAFIQRLSQRRTLQEQAVPDVHDHIFQRSLARRQADAEEGVLPPQPRAGIIPQSSELSHDHFQAHVDAALKLLNQCNNQNKKSKP
jgi:hypothetical protein